jgi:S1-C subfamily serine protease
MLSFAAAQDTVEYVDGNKRTGRLAGADNKVFKLRIPAPVAGQQAAVISINRNEVEKIIFGPDPDLETVIKDPVIGRTAFARLLWQRLEPFLSVPESPAAKAGIAYGDILLLSADAKRHNEALDLFRRIETEAWNE